jgi:hypothetical protein
MNSLSSAGLDERQLVTLYIVGVIWCLGVEICRHCPSLLTHQCNQIVPDLDAKMLNVYVVGVSDCAITITARKQVGTTAHMAHNYNPHRCPIIGNIR